MTNDFHKTSAAQSGDTSKVTGTQKDRLDFTSSCPLSFCFAFIPNPVCRCLLHYRHTYKQATGAVTPPHLTLFVLLFTLIILSHSNIISSIFDKFSQVKIRLKPCKNQLKPPLLVLPRKEGVEGCSVLLFLTAHLLIYLLSKSDGRMTARRFKALFFHICNAYLTVSVNVFFLPPALTVIVVLPAFSAVITPALSTTAISFLLDL